MTNFNSENAREMQIEGARQVLGILQGYEISFDEEAFADVMESHEACLAALSVAMGVLVSMENYLKEVESEFSIKMHVKEILEETMNQGRNQ